jgi:transcriptional regulator with PAS, ATPase and Fis domain
VQKKEKSLLQQNRVTIPFSEDNLKRVERISNFHSDLFQTIRSYSHNNFEIDIELEVIRDIEGSIGISGNTAMVDLDREVVEELFLQFIALFNASITIEPYFIDFTGFRLFLLPRTPASSPSCTVKFPLRLSSDDEQGNTLARVLAPFQQNRFFKNLNEKNHAEIFRRLKGEYAFLPHRPYLYRCDEFASALLNTYPLDELKSDSNIKIRIKTVHPFQEIIIKQNLYKNYAAKDIFFLDIENYSGIDSLAGVFSSVLSGKLHHVPRETGETCDTHDPDDYAAMIDRFNYFLKESPYKSVVLLLRQLKSREDAEFLNYLIQSSGITGIVLIVFNTPPGPPLIDFDLELKETPKNLLENLLCFHKEKKKIKADLEEIRCMKIIATLPFPISSDSTSLENVFSPRQVQIVKNLIRRDILKTVWGKLGLNVSLSQLDAVPSVEEEIEILKFYRENRTLTPAAAFNLNFKYVIKTGEAIELNRLLESYTSGKSSGDSGATASEPTAANLKTLFSDGLHLIEKDRQSVRLLVDILLKEDLTGLAGTVIEGNITKDPVYLGLKSAHIHRLNKNYIEMYRLLQQVKEKITEELANEFNYLNYIYYEKTSGISKADRHFKAISSPLFIHLANIKRSDRYIYEGNLEKAEEMLNRAADYLTGKGYGRDELEARNQLAKILRKKQQLKKAEVLYKNLFIKSEMKDYRLFAANIGVDLGNLYYDQDDFSSAESWYLKAFKIFRELQNQAGINLVESNLAEINKIKGNWPGIKKSFKAAVAFDKGQGLKDPLAIDFFNIAHLEYLMHNEAGALDFLNKALTHFQKKNNIDAISECELLKVKLSLLFSSRNRENPPVRPTDLALLIKYRQRLQSDSAILLSLFEILTQPVTYRKPFNRNIKERLEKIKSRRSRFEAIALLILSGRERLLDMSDLLQQLKSLSMQLSKETKNYYFYEYYFVYFSLLLKTEKGDPGIDENEKDIFIDMYYYFSRNKRRIPPLFIDYKNHLDEKESAYDIFRSAELVEESIHWKIPDDFFNSFLKELKKTVPVDLAQLIIYENKNPVFHFSTETKYRQITDEIIEKSIRSLDSHTFTLDRIRRICNSNEKVFYHYKGTCVLPWKLSESLSGILLFASSENDYQEDIIAERCAELFKKFGTLIHRYYEKDFKLNKKLSWLIGESLPMKHLKEQILTVARVPFSLLIRGESGTGKELVARGVHLLSDRAGKPFVAVNAAAIPDTLLEAELFGYKKGAFTGAVDNKTGLIEAAHQGTLFLDEIADLPLTLQAKLLRVLQENEIRRLGDTRLISVDFRLICATNKNLKELIKEDRFREDIFFRIQDLTIDVPPLGKRPGDILLLTRHFMEKYKFPVKEPTEFQRIVRNLEERRWVGNVRELESAVKRLITYYPDIGIVDEEEPDFSDSRPGLIEAREKLERTMVYNALKENDWNKARAAAVLKITRQYVFDLIKKHGIEED